jgi:hypothetical protein
MARFKVILFNFIYICSMHFINSFIKEHVWFPVILSFLCKPTIN